MAGNWWDPPSSVSGAGNKCVHLNCNPIDDPDTKPFRWHLGFHRQIIRSVIDHAKFEELLLKAAWHIKRNESVVVFCGCRQGRHRSVALALILQHVLDVVYGSLYAVVLEFACSNRWTAFHRRCSSGACLDCSGPMPDNIGRALELWHSV